MDWSEVHAEAELLEHSVSENLIQRIDEMLGFPGVDPHGDPIPTAGGEVQESEGANLLKCEVGVAMKVVRVGDQSMEFLRLVEREGLKPGRRLQVRERDEAAESVVLERGDREPLSLGFGAAAKILVSPVEE